MIITPSGGSATKPITTWGRVATRESLLSVGRVSKAGADLAKAERADPKSGGASALRSVIALVRDRKDDALRLAETGAGFDRDSPLPQAALSYAHQAP